MRFLTFRYVVADGDSSQGGGLDYLDPATALHFNNSIIVNGNEDMVNSALPINGVAADGLVVIDTSSPQIIAVDTDTPDGEYGAGEVITFQITYNLPVVVKGVPFIRLSAVISTPTSSPLMEPSFSPTFGEPSKIPSYSNPTEEPVDSPTYDPTLHPSATPTVSPTFDPTDSPGTVHNTTQEPTYLPSSLPSSKPSSRPSAYPSYGYQSSAVAKYSSSSADKKTLYFEYVVGENEFTPVGQNLYIVSTFLQFQNPRRDWIKRDANVLSTLAGLNIDFGYASLSAHFITIDTSPPMLSAAYGVQTTHINGLFYPGEEIFLSVQFDKPVVARGDAIFLVLDCGVHARATPYDGYAYITQVLSDNVTVEFLYVVEKHVNTSSKVGMKLLDIKSGGEALVIISEQNSYIRRKSTVPTTNVNSYTDSVYGSLSATSSISLLGFPPVVETITIQATSPAGASLLQPDDYVLVDVAFSTYVIATCSPVLVLAVGFYREAVYYSGNGTEVFTFK